MLTLPIKKKWFDMICSGEKPEDYREIKKYWTKRFGWQDEHPYPDHNPPARVHKLVMLGKDMEVVFKNGYSQNSPYIKCWVHITKGQGRIEWGAVPGKEYYVLFINKIIETGNL